MMTAPTYTLRRATRADLPAMVQVYASSFAGSPLNDKIFPSSDPETLQTFRNTCARYFEEVSSPAANAANHLFVVEYDPSKIAAAGDTQDEGSRTRDESFHPEGDIAPGAKVIAWCRWVSRPAPASTPRHIVSPSDFPPSGDVQLGVSVFQANVDVFRDVMADSPCWFLSMILVDEGYQRKGVGNLMMKFGVDRADEEGKKCFVNASVQGKRLYEKFGFETVKVSDFGQGVCTFHMVRERTSYQESHLTRKEKR